MDKLKELWLVFDSWLNTAGIGQTIVIGLIIYFAGSAVIRVLRTIVRKTVLKTSNDETLARFASGVAFQLMRVILVVVVLGTLGVDTTSLAAAIGGLGVALGFALKDTIGNLAAGILLILHRPFDEGDFIEAGGEMGTVEEITISSTRLSTGDNKALMIPNGMLATGVITNYSQKDIRRVDLAAGIGYEDDIDKAKGILEDIVKSHELVLEDPAPVVELNELADSSVNFVVRPWCKTGDYWRVYFDVTEQIKKRFDEAGVSIPYPQQDVHMHQVA